LVETAYFLTWIAAIRHWLAPFYQDRFRSDWPAFYVFVDVLVQDKGKVPPPASKFKQPPSKDKEENTRWRLLASAEIQATACEIVAELVEEEYERFETEIISLYHQANRSARAAARFSEDSDNETQLRRPLELCQLVKSPPDGTGISPPDEPGNNDLRPVTRIGSPCGGESARPHKPRPANCGRSDTPPARSAIASCWRLHRPTSVWTLLEAVNRVIGLTALHRIVRALRWDAVRGRGPTDLGRYPRSPRGPKRWRPYTSWGRFTSRGGVHVRHTQRQLANSFR
jgi:hypothetical protein